MDACPEKFFSCHLRVLLQDLGHGTADGHGNVHNGAHAGDQKAGEEQTAHLDPVGVPERHQCFDIRYVISGNSGKNTEKLCGDSGTEDPQHGPQDRYHSLFGGASDQVHGHDCGDGAYKNRRPERGQSPVYQRKIDEDHTEKGEDQSGASFDSLFSSDYAQKKNI